MTSAKPKTGSRISTQRHQGTKKLKLKAQARERAAVGDSPNKELDSTRFSDILRQDAYGKRVGLQLGLAWPLDGLIVESEQT